MRFTVSVVIPCYLPGASASQILKLRESVQSAVDQDYPDEMEILLVDDGNGVPLAKLIDISSFPCAVRVVRQRRNMGLVLALNRGINEARYNFIARLDADDVWLPGKIRAQYQKFKADPDTTLVATGMVRVDEAGRFIDQHIRPDGWANIARFFVESGCPFPHGSVLARKDIYQALGLYSQDATFAHCEDYHLWGQWIRFFKTAIVEEPYYRYTVSNSSVSGRNAEQQLAASQIVLHHFRTLGVDQAYVDNITKISIALGLTQVDVGRLLFDIWQSTGSVFKVPSEILNLIRLLLTDRYFLEVSGFPTIKFDQFGNHTQNSDFVNVYVASV